MRTYKPREWPNTHKEARDNAADEIAAALKLTVGLIDSDCSAETLRKISKAVNHLQNALRHLESAGAATRPITQ